MRFAVIDTETTGLDPKFNEIVQIGAVLVDTEARRYEPLYESLANPGWSSEQLKKIWIVQHGYLKIEDILNAPPAEQVAEEFRKKLGNTPWTAYNLYFDKRFLFKNPWNLSPGGLPDIMNPAATRACKIRKNGRPKWPKLEEAFQILVKEEIREQFGDQTHTALKDCIMAAEVLFELMDRRFYEISTSY